MCCYLSQPTACVIKTWLQHMLFKQKTLPFSCYFFSFFCKFFFMVKSAELKWPGRLLHAVPTGAQIMRKCTAFRAIQRGFNRHTRKTRVLCLTVYNAVEILNLLNSNQMALHDRRQGPLLLLPAPVRGQLFKNFQLKCCS
ncbi:hypothetical protein MATL_G00016410 [Megalops atlanticus]|uniref:Uncharacterized protein n=1 Tax=Megalops atlanticus TaxID=7932 RepID=A0A9D3TK30_MEGAT|nr:hypothetical protein MATL_G00016410 [Megalops atlanticus]